MIGATTKFIFLNSAAGVARGEEKREGVCDVPCECCVYEEEKRRRRSASLVDFCRSLLQTR